MSAKSKATTHTNLRNANVPMIVASEIISDGFRKIKEGERLNTVGNQMLAAGLLAFYDDLVATQPRGEVPQWTFIAGTANKAESDKARMWFSRKAYEKFLGSETAPTIGNNASAEDHEKRTVWVAQRQALDRALRFASCITDSGLSLASYDAHTNMFRVPYAVLLGPHDSLVPSKGGKTEDGEKKLTVLDGHYISVLRAVDKDKVSLASIYASVNQVVASYDARMAHRKAVSELRAREAEAKINATKPVTTDGTAPPATGGTSPVTGATPAPTGGVAPTPPVATPAVAKGADDVRNDVGLTGMVTRMVEAIHAVALVLEPGNGDKSEPVKWTDLDATLRTALVKAASDFQIIAEFIDKAQSEPATPAVSKSTTPNVKPTTSKAASK